MISPLWFCMELRSLSRALSSLGDGGRGWVIKTYLGGDVQSSIRDVQVPDDEDEAGGHAGGVGAVRHAVNGTVVGVVRRLVVQRHVCKLWCSLRI